MSSLALFAHILGGFLFFAGIAVATAGYESARTRGRPREVALLLEAGRRGVALLGLGAALILGFGLWLVDLRGHSLSEAWIVASLALFVLAAVLGALGGQRPKRARFLARRLAGEGDHTTQELTSLLSDPTSRVAN